MQQNNEDDIYYNDGYPDQEEVERLQALNLKWTIGMNFQLVDGVHNLSKKNESLKIREIFYASAHTGVIYDFKSNQQRLLQGHCNKITCNAYCVQEDIIVTCDSGPDSMLIVWDSKTGNPRKTIFDPHPNGTQAVDISPDGQLIVTVSKEEGDQLQTISLWDWSRDKKPIVTCEMDSRMRDSQSHVRFNQDNPKEFVTTGKRRIIFWSWEPNVKGFEFYSPAFSHKKLFTQTVFIPNSTQAVTGTQDGFIVVWDISLIMEDYSQPEERRAIKVVNLMNTQNKMDISSTKKPSAAINILKIQGKWLVVGSSTGSIRFYDFQYRIMAWFEDIDVGSITSLSFSYDETMENESLKPKDKDDLGGDEVFTCPKFIVVDNTAKITRLKSKLFDSVDQDKKKGNIILKSIVSPIVSIAVRPNSNFLAISCENATVYEWNFHEKTKVLTVLKEFENDFMPTCIKYSPDGRFLSVATKSGNIHFYEVDKKEWQAPILISETDRAKPKILMEIFANDSQHLAAMDEHFAVSLFRIDHKYEDKTQPKEWIFAGKSRVHLLPIKSIAFGESLNEKGETRLRLFSIGEDKKMVEYDVMGSSAQNGLKIANLNVYPFPIEQECNPTACVWYPINLYKEDVLLTVNEQYKIKLWSIMSSSNQNNNKSIICKKTCLGPTYGEPITKLHVLFPTSSKSQHQDNYLAYSTNKKVVGIIKLPLDGNPNNAMGLIAHPGEIRDISATSDGKYFFTCGGDDHAVNMWYVDVSVLEKNFFQEEVVTVGQDDPYANFLEGGPEGQTYRNLKDFFYYSQIRAKSEHTTKARKLDGKVPLSSISEMMRALGYYPTDKEIENMQNEIKFSKYSNSGEFVTELNLNMFLRQFVNHRPVYGIVRSEIEEALRSLMVPGTGKLTRDELIDALQREGEKMNHQEIKELTNILMGEGSLEELLPDIIYDNEKKVNNNFFLDNVLGFEDMEEGKIEENDLVENQEDEEEEQHHDDN